MQAHATRIDTEIESRIRPRRLGPCHQGWHHQSLMATPADAELEDLQPVGKMRDIDAVLEGEGEQA